MFDVQAVCSGFVYALSVADAMISLALPASPGGGASWFSAAFSASTTARPACCLATVRRCGAGGV